MRAKMWIAAGTLLMTLPAVSAWATTNASEFVGQSVPEAVPVRQIDIPVSVSFRNTGTQTWGAGYGIVAKHDPANRWGPQRVLLRPGETVLSAGRCSDADPHCNEHTFEFLISAPQVPGAYSFQWQMRDAGGKPFGAATSVVQVRVDPICGDGVLHSPWEDCDDGNTESGDCCGSTCVREFCGDGIVQTRCRLEECDEGPGNGNSPDSCRSDCRLPRCGDTITDPVHGEECDNGPANSNTAADACRTNCTKARCGDGIRDPAHGEDCDLVALGDRTCQDFPQAQGGSLSCSSECTYDLAACWICGNDVLDPGEECDEGAANSDIMADACRSDCRTAHCGDAVLDTSEECDDGERNGTGADQCRPETCKAPFCGDGIADVGRGEECDAGTENGIGPNQCRPLSCRLPYCGDAVVDTDWEECDDGSANSDSAPNACRTECRKPFCGDGVRDSGEECDDGNAVDGDGCSLRCEQEAEARVGTH